MLVSEGIVGYVIVCYNCMMLVSILSFSPCLSTMQSWIFRYPCELGSISFRWKYLCVSNNHSFLLKFWFGIWWEIIWCWWVQSLCFFPYPSKQIWIGSIIKALLCSVVIWFQNLTNAFSLILHENLNSLGNHFGLYSLMVYLVFRVIGSEDMDDLSCNENLHKDI